MSILFFCIIDLRQELDVTENFILFLYNLVINIIADSLHFKSKSIKELMFKSLSIGLEWNTPVAILSDIL